MVHFQRWLLFSCISKDILVNDTAYVTDKLKNKNNISGTVQFNITNHCNKVEQFNNTARQLGGLIIFD